MQKQNKMLYAGDKKKQRYVQKKKRLPLRYFVCPFFMTKRRVFLRIGGSVGRGRPLCFFGEWSYARGFDGRGRVV